jgi:transposase
MGATISISSERHIGVGIDTARYGHRIHFLREDKQPAAEPITIREDRQGYKELKQKLDRLHQKHPEAQFHIHLDAAGQYATNLIRYLQSLALPLVVSVGEPARNKNYQKTFSPKRTCDDTESRAMARYGVVEQPSATPSNSDEIYILQEVVGRQQGRVRDTTRAINRLHNVLARVFPELSMIVPDIAADYVLTMLHQYSSPERIRAVRTESLRKIPFMRAARANEIREAAKNSTGSLKGSLAEQLVRETVEDVQRCKRAEERMEALMSKALAALPASGHVHVSSILGIGEATAAVLVGKIVSISRFETADKLVGYFGVFPEEDSSGVDKDGKPLPSGKKHMSYKGSDVVRRYLWNATLAGIKCNPAIRALYHRKRLENKRHDVAMGHCMRKLLHLVFAVWTTNTPFDPNHHAWDREANRSAEAQPTTEEGGQTISEEVNRQEEKAAGHKQDVVLDSSVVTATNCKVNMETSIVKTANTTRTSRSVDYQYLRQQITMQQVLNHLGLLTGLQKGGRGECRGPCPLHGSKDRNSRSFAVNLSKNAYKCFAPSCGQSGNVLDFWAAYHKQSIHQAALSLAQTFNLDLQHEQRRGARNSSAPSQT